MIFRIRKNAHYVTINNRVLRDERLSWCARGVMAFLLTLKGTENVTIDSLTERAREGRRRVANALKELEHCGYFERKRFKTEGGKWEWEMNVFEDPPQADIHTTVSGRMETGSLKDRKTKEEIPLPPLPPAPFLGNDFLEALAEFVEHRKIIKKPLTAIGIKRLFADLTKWGEVASVDSLHNSVRNGWQGVFEPKQNGFKTQADMNAGGRGRPVVI